MLSSLLGFADVIIDGENLKPLLEQTGEPAPRDLYWHFPHYWWGQVVKPYSIIRSGNFKLIKLWDQEITLLYDLDKDVSEEYNLAEEMPEKVKELEEKLNNWFEETGAKLPLKNPLFKK